MRGRVKAGGACLAVGHSKVCQKPVLDSVGHTGYALGRVMHASARAVSVLPRGALDRLSESGLGSLSGAGLGHHGRLRLACWRHGARIPHVGQHGRLRPAARPVLTSWRPYILVCLRNSQAMN